MDVLPTAADSTNGFLNPSLYSNCTINTCPVLTSYYNYRINLIPNVVFLVLFSLWLPVFSAIWILKRRGLFFTLAMQSGIIAEMIGYIGRIISYHDQWDMNGYLMQLVCLTLGPAFFSAGIYVCLGRIIIVYGAENSRLRPQWYTRTVSLAPPAVAADL
jgi:RTA1 like protein